MIDLRTASALERLVVVTVVGCIAGAIAARFVPWPFAVLTGWDAAAAALVGSVWLTVGRFTAEETRDLGDARGQQPYRHVADPGHRQHRKPGGCGIRDRPFGRRPSG